MIKVGEITLSKEEFLDQVKDIFTEEQIQECLAAGKYRHLENRRGKIKWCPKCEKIRQTSCCTCGCGNCKDCGCDGARLCIARKGASHCACALNIERGTYNE